MKQAFISYNIMDDAVARMLGHILQKNGITSVRLDPCAVNYDDIQEKNIVQIDNCDIVIYLLSENTGKSGLFELGIAKSKNKPIIIIELDETLHPFDIKDYICIKLSENTPNGWVVFEKKLKKALTMTGVPLDTEKVEQEESPINVGNITATAKPRVFISHDSHEYAQADRYRKILEDNNIPCWIADRDIPFGSNYAREIPVAIKECRCVLVFVSKHSQTSENIEKEIEIAVEYNKPIIPVRLQDCEFEGPYIYHLKNKQWFNAYKASEEDKQKLIKNLMSYGNAAADEPREKADEPEEKKKTSKIKGKIRKFKEWYKEQTSAKKTVVVLAAIVLIAMMVWLFTSTEVGIWTTAVFAVLFGEAVSIVMLIAFIIFLVATFISA